MRFTALLSVTAMLALCVREGQTTQIPPQAPQPYQALGREILAQLVGIDTTAAEGTSRAAEAIGARVRAAGFPERDIAVLAPSGRPDKVNVVVRLRGRGDSGVRPVLYISHLDVVEARQEDWTTNPFQLSEREGWLYGRGTIDMKGQAAAVMVSLIRMKAEGVVPSRDIIAAFTPDEEIRGPYGVDWLLKEHPDTVDAALVINPDGGEAGHKAGKKLYVAVQTSEKIFMTVRLEATDSGGHSSRPKEENPIYRVAAALERLRAWRFPVHLTDTTREFFRQRASIESGTLQADMRSVLLAPPDANALARLSASVETNIQLRSTCTTTMIEGGHAENALPQRARATVQCRLIPGESPEAALDTIRRTLDDPKISMSVITPAIVAPESPLAPPVFAAVRGVVASMWSGVAVLPQMSAGATDSVYTRARGIPSYGIDGTFDDLDDGRAHGRDERIGVVAFAEELEFTYRLMKSVGELR